LERQRRPCDIGILAARESIAELLEAFIQSAGWTAFRIPRVGHDGVVSSCLTECRLILYDLDLPDTVLGAVHATGRPILYFSGSRPRPEVVVPEGAVFFELPPDWAALDRLIRSRL
jgi:hypothetical protein